MVTVLMLSAKMAVLGLLKIKIFWRKGYDDKISVHDVTKKILSRYSNYNVNMVMWPKFGNFSISVIEAIITLILPEKPLSLRGGLVSSSIIWV